MKPLREDLTSDDLDPKLMVVHQEVPGKHDRDSETCWCRPHVLVIRSTRGMDEMQAVIAKYEGHLH